MTPAASTSSPGYQPHPEIKGANQGVLWGSDERGQNIRQFYYQIGDETYIFKSEEDRGEFLDIVAQEVDVAACDPDFQDAAKSFVREHSKELGDGRFDRGEAWEAFKAPFQSPYFGGNVPNLPYESGEFLSHPPDFEDSAPVVQARRAAIIKTAQISHDRNYGVSDAKGMNEGVALTGEDHAIITAMVGEIWPDKTVTKGRLNILAQMGLISIIPNSTPPQFKITDLGNGFMNPADYAAISSPEFCPSVNLFAPKSQDFPRLAENPEPADIETAGQSFYAAQGSVPEAPPSGLTTSSQTENADISKLVTELLGIYPPIQTIDKLTPRQLNTAIALGLISLESSGLSITERGSNYLKLKKAEEVAYNVSGNPGDYFTPADTTNSGVKYYRFEPNSPLIAAAETVSWGFARTDDNGTNEDQDHTIPPELWDKVKIGELLTQEEYDTVVRAMAYALGDGSQDRDGSDTGIPVEPQDEWKRRSFVPLTDPKKGYVFIYEGSHHNVWFQPPGNPPPAPVRLVEHTGDYKRKDDGLQWDDHSYSRVVLDPEATKTGLVYEVAFRIPEDKKSTLSDLVTYAPDSVFGTGATSREGLLAAIACGNVSQAQYDFITQIKIPA